MSVMASKRPLTCLLCMWFLSFVLCSLRESSSQVFIGGPISSGAPPRPLTKGFVSRTANSPSWWETTLTKNAAQQTFAMSFMQSWFPPWIYFYTSVSSEPMSTSAVLVALVMTVVATSYRFNRNHYLNMSMIAHHTCLVSFFFLPMPLGDRAVILCLTWILAALKMCLMSVCLHRYASHEAFKCDGNVRFLICLLGCFANQGGPIWWAANHRCHHAMCDEPDDPHSPIHKSFEEAYGFAYEPGGLDLRKEYVPKHLDSPDIRIIDAWSKLPVLLEYCLAYYLGGIPGLWVATTSAWLSFTATLYFNVVYHYSPDASTTPVGCQARDGLPLFQQAPNPFFTAGHWMLTSVKWFMGEDTHKHHHDNPGLAKRPGLDLSYKLLIEPLAATGLAWDLDRKSRETRRAPVLESVQ
mmetsp:Transcript_68947/g.121910  ORF Transcript_68947/g.121910 Transcript_68947/m.121910 type:complete len:410 (-) Transcript_68947:340-1569(-)